MHFFQENNSIMFDGEKFQKIHVKNIILISISEIKKCK